MRLHKLDIGARHINLDGVPLIISDDFNLEHLGEGVQAFHCTIYCSDIVLNGDTHDSPMPTPIFDQLTKELHH